MLQLHSYVLPIMQGYYQIAHFNIPPDPVTHDENVVVDYIIVSRRSRYRAGLRYQRRGIDDDANVANFVETETIIRVEVILTFLFRSIQSDGGILPASWSREYLCLCSTPGIKFVCLCQMLIALCS